MLWWSGSQRLRLWLDGELISEGPPRSDRECWAYVEVALPALAPGLHELKVEQVHYGPFGGKGQIGGPSFFLCALEAEALQAWNSDAPGWRCAEDRSRSFWAGELKATDQVKRGGHRAVGRGQLLDQSRGELHWVEVRRIPEMHNNPWGNRSLGCHLVENLIPAMERVPLAAEWVLGEMPEQGLILAPGEQGRWIADLGGVTLFEPLLRWSGGAGATITLSAVEVALDRESSLKLRRPDLTQVALPGHQDRILCSGAAGSWSPEWFRSGRYLVLDLQAGEEELKLEAPECFRRGFPLQEQLELQVEDGRNWSELLEVNRRTNRGCSQETFFDCPGWEQAQFPGDARIQARQHYLAYNEDRLGRKAIQDLAAGCTPSGLLHSHWPSSYEQVISTYSLQWIGMLQDFYLYRDDPDFLIPFLPCARGILDWFLQRRRADGLLGRIPEAPFIDWAFPAGCPEQEAEGGSSILTALLSEACGWMAKLESAIGYAEMAPRWQEASERLCQALALCQDVESGMLRNSPSGGFSVHAQVQAALAGFGSKEEAGQRLLDALADPEATQPQTLYYRAHLAEALRSCGLQGEVNALFKAWFDFLDEGCRTWPESDGEGSRSDCHGWGCLPEVEAVHSLFGLEPAAPGWSKLSFAPGLPDGLSASLKLQLPQGLLTLSREGTSAWELDLPEGVELLDA